MSLPNTGYAKTPYQVEHAQPVSRGGTDAPDNLRLACEECNRHKGMLTEAEFLAVLATRG